jgi:ribonucleoside-diphosphate reductase alpha chain
MVTLTPHQQTIFLDRYAKRDENNLPIESNIEGMWARVAHSISFNDAEATEFYNLLSDFKFVPGGRILAGAGTEADKTFYNCYVIPIEANHPIDHYPNNYAGNDSREAIFDTMQRMVTIMSQGGGVGINFSVLRPQGAYLKRVSGSSSGPVGWMNVFSTAVGEVEQGGSRRGAAMFMLDDWHPDIERFVNEKRNNSKIINANVSVAVSNRFMDAVNADADWDLIFPDTSHADYNKTWDGDINGWISRGLPVKVYKTLKARELWSSLADAAWSSGEPGIVFLDRYNEQSTAASIERIICVNPCGEQGLGAYSVCNLGAMNIRAYVKQHARNEIYPELAGDFYVDWQAFRSDVRSAITFLDNVIDTTRYNLPETRNQQMKLRRVGLGIMGLADALVLLGMRYGSEDALYFTDALFYIMKEEAIAQSIELSRTRGSALGWDASMMGRPYLAEYLHDHPESYDDMLNYGMRNLFLLTQAPTGTTSALAGVNSGIEPFFALEWTRVDRTGTHQVRPDVLVGIDLTNKPDYVVTSSDVSVEEHIAMQAVVQQLVDSSVSKTINAPNSQSRDETEKAYTLAYERGLKGLAYYRDGSRDVQVLYKKDPNAHIRELEEEVAELKAKLAFKSIAAARAGALSYGPESDKCPSCEIGDVVFEEGCKMCHSCGWAAC